ncbi:MAG: aminotransferase, partial [Bacteroidota bacterium]
MPDSRRSFIHKIGGALGLSLTSPFYNTLQGQDLLTNLANYQHLAIDKVIQDETFWYQIKHAYTVSPTILNFNNGGV